MSGAYTSILPRCLHAADSGNCTFTFLCFTERYYRLGRRRSSAVSLVTRLGAGSSGVPNSHSEKRFFCSPKRPGTALGTTRLPIQWVARFFPWYSGKGVKLTHSPPSIAEVRNEWRYNSTPHICLCGVDKDFTVTLWPVGIISLNCQMVSE